MVDDRATANITGSSADDTSFYNTVISALRAAEGKDDEGNPNGDGLSSYSSVGSSVWASAHGGGYGSTAPTMVTTDIVSVKID